MDDQKQVERFNADLDLLIQTGAYQSSGERNSEDYTKLIGLARSLSSIDFSVQSQIRSPLRKRLLSGRGKREGWFLKERPDMQVQLNKRRPWVALSLVALIGLALLMLTSFLWPGSVAAAAQNAIDLIKRIWVGEHTSITPINPDQIVQLEDGSLVLQAEYAGGTGSSEMDPRSGNGTYVEFQVLQFDTIAQAQASVPFAIHQPGYLPEGYVLSHIKVFGEGNQASTNITYRGPGGDLLLSQRMPELAGQETLIGLPDDYKIEMVTVNGQSATWAEHVLMWEADGVSYLLSSPDLSLAEALRIAESLN